jgi:predicted metalloendopeptidase
MKIKTSRYKAWMAQLFKLANAVPGAASDEDYAAAAQSIFDMEKKIAEGHESRTDLRDPHKTLNKTKLTEWQKKVDEEGGEIKCCL